MSIPRRWWENLIAFLFAPETDKWLGALRIGLGLLVTAYALFLRSDWHNLFASTGKGLVSRKLGEAITSFDSPLIPKLGWLGAAWTSLGTDALLGVMNWVALFHLAARERHRVALAM